MALGCNSLHSLQRNLFTPFPQLWILVSSLNPSGCLFVCVSCMLGLTQKHKCHKATLLCNKSLVTCARVFSFFFFPPSLPRSGSHGCFSLLSVISFELWKQTWTPPPPPPFTPQLTGTQEERKQSGIKAKSTKTTVLLFLIPIQ